MLDFERLFVDEPYRRREFPCCDGRIFLAHAAVTSLPRVAVEALAEFAALGARGAQENSRTEEVVAQCRKDAARLIGAQPDEIALLGPTSLGLSLVARGLAWRPGDEIIYYGDDYPANVYPWTALAAYGVKPVALQPRWPGVIEWEQIEGLITPRTRLVALATCHFLGGFRIDAEGIGERLRERGILYCLDAIQTLGAFPLNATQVDFLSADSHKWLLGPAGAGILYVRRDRQEMLTPALLGSWNVVSPDFVAQPQIAYEHGGRRYEPGILNLPGIFGMAASLQMLLHVGVERIAERLLLLRSVLVEGARAKGYRLYLEEWEREAGAGGDTHRSGIVTLHRPGVDLTPIASALREAGASISLRKNRIGESYLRFAPHFYNTEEELERVLKMLP